MHSEMLQNLIRYDNNILLNEVVVNAPQKDYQSRGLGNMRINSQVLQVSPLFFGERDVIKTLQFLPGVSGMEDRRNSIFGVALTIRRCI